MSWRQIRCFLFVKKCLRGVFFERMEGELFVDSRQQSIWRIKIPSIARYLYTIIQWYTFRSDTCWCAAFVGGVSFDLLMVNIRNDVSKLDQCWSPSIVISSCLLRLYAFLHLPDFWVPWRFNKWCVCSVYYVCCCIVVTSPLAEFSPYEIWRCLEP